VCVCVCVCVYSISQKWVQPSHFTKYFSISTQGTILYSKIYPSFISSQCAACIAVYIYCPLKITQHKAIIVKIAGNKSEFTLTIQSHMSYSSCSCFCLLDRTLQIIVFCIRAVKICAMSTVQLSHTDHWMFNITPHGKELS